MANRSFTDYALTLEKSPVTLYGDVQVGAVGAPTVVTKNSKGIKSVVRNSAGRYTITLSDTYFKFFGVDVTIVASGGPAAPLVSVVSQAVTSLAAPKRS